MGAQALKERTRSIWDKGDYSHLSKRLEPASPTLSDACPVSAGQEVLDVAAGDGNFALACAREGASVVACDISPGMVERGRARAPPEPDLVPSERWGDEATARERLEPLFARVEFERRAVEWTAESPEAFVKE